MRMQIKYDLLGFAFIVIGQVILFSTLFSPRAETLLFGMMLDCLFVFSALICIFCGWKGDGYFKPSRISLCKMNLDSVHTRKSR